MNREFMPYEEALVIKELGFDEPCVGKYSNYIRKDYYIGNKLTTWEFLKRNEPELNFENIYNNVNSGLSKLLDFDFNAYISAPTYSQAFRWFREKHNLDSSVIREKVKVDGKWIKSKFYMYSIENNDEFPLSLGFDLKDDATYEEAEMACLKKLIEIVKEKK